MTPNQPLKAFIKRFVTVFFFVFFSVFQVYSQAPPRNSQQRPPNPDILIKQGEELIKSDDVTQQAEGYFTIGSTAMRKNDIDLAVTSFEKAAELSAEAPFDLKVRIMRMQASAYGRSEKYDKLSAIADVISTLAKKENDNSLYAIGLSYKARSQMRQGDLNKAVDNYLAAAKIFDSLKSPNLITTYADLANTYARLYQNEEAAKWYKRAYEEAQVSNEPRLLQMTTKNLAANFGVRKMPDSSVFYYNKLLKKKNEISPLQLSSIYQNLASAYVSLDKLDLAKASLEKAKAFDLPDYNGQRAIMLLAVELKLYNSQENYDAAEKVVDSSVNLIKKYRSTPYLYPLYLEIAQVKQKQGKLDEAYEALATYTKIKDSLIKHNDLGKVLMAANAYDLDAKEEELVAALDQNKKSSTYLIVIGVTAIAIIIVLVLVYKKYRKTKHTKEQLEERHKAMLASFKKLQDGLKAKENLKEESLILNNKQVIKLNKVAYVKSEGHYLDYYVEDQELPITERNSLKDRLENLEQQGFLQVHRSFVVNLEKVKAVHTAQVILEDGNTIPLSRTYKQMLREERHPLFAS